MTKYPKTAGPVKRANFTIRSGNLVFKMRGTFRAAQTWYRIIKSMREEAQTWH